MGLRKSPSGQEIQQGVATLSSGSIVLSNISYEADSIALATRGVAGTGVLSCSINVGAKTLTIQSSNPADNIPVFWAILD